MPPSPTATNTLSVYMIENSGTATAELRATHFSPPLEHWIVPRAPTAKKILFALVTP